MTKWFNGFWRGFIDEVFMRSAYGEKVVADTFFRWLVGMSFFVGFYFSIYHFDEYAVRFDQWGHEALGWKLSVVPSSGKVAWHRLAAGGLAGVGVIFVTLGYVTALYRRIKARIAKSKAEAEQSARPVVPSPDGS